MAKPDGGWQPPTGVSPRPMLMGAPRNALRAFNAGVSLASVVDTNVKPLFSKLGVA